MIAAAFLVWTRPDGWADFVRYATIGLGLIIVGWSFAVLHLASKFEAPPWPIRLGAISYILLEIGFIAEVHARIGAPVTWRLPLIVAANIVGVITIGVMAWYYDPDRRAERHRKLANIAAEKLLANQIPERRHRKRRITDPDPPDPRIVL